MGAQLYINYLVKQIESTEAELQQAFDMRKSFYEIKEVVQRLKLLLNELAQLKEEANNS